MCLRLIEPRQQFGHCLPQLRQVLSHNQPGDFEIDREVVMHKNMAHTDDVAPGHRRIEVANRIRESIGGLADNLEVRRRSAGDLIGALLRTAPVRECVP